MGRECPITRKGFHGDAGRNFVDRSAFRERKCWNAAGMFNARQGRNDEQPWSGPLAQTVRPAKEDRMTARDVMTPNPVTATAQASIAEVWDLMRELEIRHVPVVDRGAL